MKTVRLVFDYGACLTWLYDENGSLIDNAYPPELEEHPETIERLDHIENTYYDLFVNDPNVFEWRGFATEAEATKFLEFIRETVTMVKEQLAGLYDVVDDIRDKDVLD